MQQPEISIVIVNYNVKDLVLTCLKSLYFYLPSTFSIETILVDNNSSDESVAAIAKEFPQVVLIENKFNAGFPAANNQAFEIAKGKYIFMLNPDTEFLDDAIQNLFSYMENHPEIDLLAPKLLNSDRSRQLSVWRYPTLWYLFCETHYLKFFLNTKNYFDKDLTKPFEADAFSGAAIFFKKEIVHKIGMLDETMFWIEDVEFCYRANHFNLKLIYNPEIQIVHHIGQSAKKNYNISLSNQIVNKIKFYKKFHSTFQWQLVVLLSFYHVITKFIVFGLLSPFNKTYYRKAKAYLYTLPLVFNPPMGMK